METKENLPNSWVNCILEDIVNEVNSGFPSGKHNKEQKGIPHIRPMNINYDGNIDLSVVKYVENNPHDYLRKGDVLFNNTNSPKLLGKTALIKQDTDWAYSNHMTRIRFNTSLIEPRWIAYYLHKLFWEGYYKIRATNHVNQSSINSTYLSKQIPIFLAPLNEQKRIVAKIDEFFSKIDSTLDSLRKTKLQLKFCKSSLLQSGFLGELTKARRDNNPAESVEPLIEKIKKIQNKQEKKLQKIQIPEEDEYFHQIPNSWKWARVGNVCFRLQYGTSEKANNDASGIPVLRMGNIIDGELNFNDLKFFPKNWRDKDEFLLGAGDVLFNRTNSAELVGKTAVFEDHHPSSVFASYLIRAKVAIEIILPKILSYYVNSVFGRMFIKSVVSQQVGQANVNGTKFAMMYIPLIPMNEQLELIDKIETGISLIQNMSKEVDMRLQNLLSLKSSILKEAFDGNLVPQDPNDEPSSLLLERIKQEKESQTNTKRKSK